MKKFLSILFLLCFSWVFIVTVQGRSTEKPQDQKPPQAQVDYTR